MDLSFTLIRDCGPLTGILLGNSAQPKWLAIDTEFPAVKNFTYPQFVPYSDANGRILLHWCRSHRK